MHYLHMRKYLLNGVENAVTKGIKLLMSNFSFYHTVFESLHADNASASRKGLRKFYLHP